MPARKSPPSAAASPKPSHKKQEKTLGWPAALAEQILGSYVEDPEQGTPKSGRHCVSCSMQNLDAERHIPDPDQDDPDTGTCLQCLEQAMDLLNSPRNLTQALRLQRPEQVHPIVMLIAHYHKPKGLFKKFLAICPPGKSFNKGIFLFTAWFPHFHTFVGLKEMLGPLGNMLVHSIDMMQRVVGPAIEPTESKPRTKKKDKKEVMKKRSQERSKKRAKRERQRQRQTPPRRQLR